MKKYVTPYTFRVRWNKRLGKFKRYRTPFKVWRTNRKQFSHILKFRNLFHCL